MHGEEKETMPAIRKVSEYASAVAWVNVSVWRAGGIRLKVDPVSLGVGAGRAPHAYVHLPTQNLLGCRS